MIKFSGIRFGIYQTKVGLIRMLQNFKVNVCEKTMIPYIKKINSFTLAPKDGIFLKVEKITDCGKIQNN